MNEACSFKTIVTLKCCRIRRFTSQRDSKLTNHLILIFQENRRQNQHWQSNHAHKLMSIWEEEAIHYDSEQTLMVNRYKHYDFQKIETKAFREDICLDGLQLKDKVEVIRHLIFENRMLCRMWKNKDLSYFLNGMLLFLIHCRS